MRRTAAILQLAWPLAAFAAGDEPIVPQDAVAEYQRRAQAASPCVAGEGVTLPVAAEPPVEASYDAATGRLHLHYGMFFNDLTEGWNWHPLAAAEGGDYYAFKFLPLASRMEEGASYPVDNGPGQPNAYAVQTRTDYFFAFDNPDDFYSRDAGDARGFDAVLPLPAPEAQRIMNGGLRMALRGSLRQDCRSASTTFWKATVAAPVDYTLLKRYLIGKLDEVLFLDAVSGRVVAHLPANAAPTAR